MPSNRDNPFSLTYSAHMSDEEIDQLWVDLSIDGVSKVKDKHAVIVIGGKGCGKTHLMRYHSFPLQQRRHSKQDSLAGIQSDGYIGIYMRCGGLMASRFSGKGYPDELWESLFEYSIELYLAEQLLAIICQLGEQVKFNETVSRKLAGLIGDEDHSKFETPERTRAFINNLRKQLDSSINNCVFGESLLNNPSTRVRTNRGDLIFKIPQILSEEIQNLKAVYFIYLIDEYENFTESQQKYVNTLMREMEGPVSIKFGVRKYGIKTRETLSDNEELIEGSDYERLPLDEQLRDNAEAYRRFCYNILQNRLNDQSSTSDDEVKVWAKQLFETVNFDWSSENIHEITNNKIKRNIQNTNAHFQSFENKLKEIGVSGKDSKKILKNLSVPKHPLLEKTNIYNFYKKVDSVSGAVNLSELLKEDCEKFIKEKAKTGPTYSAWSHYKNDIVDQYLNEYGIKPFYSGIDNFIDMSEGMPRNFINILKHVYNWAVFQNDDSFTRESKFSLLVQQKAIIKSSEWAFDDLRKAGKDLEPLQTSIRRLAKLFQINHFADKPSECSLISFASNLSLASPNAQRLINIAEQRSLLIKTGERQDKNFGASKSQYRLSKMLCPLWNLPIAQRGTIEIPPADIDIIFDPVAHDDKEFRSLADAWIDKRKVKKPSNEQPSLFE